MNQIQEKFLIHIWLNPKEGHEIKGLKVLLKHVKILVKVLVQMLLFKIIMDMKVAVYKVKDQRHAVIVMHLIITLDDAQHHANYVKRKVILI
ncbi:hypothetical protein RirG_252260 [Rhizophagus irregularis DAOM 197198w]|uniref:Uncharacterized protein n=1 Tax=Rhizophagus irregularis (strain DAOM 197198w) TaxID=1432141 RepID=A0A015JZD6_RHIIW|nr:hypothetical protein RirG_252260 [Rhizophagus irregularis DAOM 197198w]